MRCSDVNQDQMQVNWNTKIKHQFKCIFVDSEGESNGDGEMFTCKHEI